MANGNIVVTKQVMGVSEAGKKGNEVNERVHALSSRRQLLSCSRFSHAAIEAQGGQI